MSRSRSGPLMCLVDRSYRTVDSASFSERISLFVERVHEYEARVRNRSGPRSCHRQSLTPVRPGRAAAGRARRPAGWIGTSGVTLLHKPGLSNDVLEHSDGVLTAAAMGIAQTGTIVLDSGPGQGRRASPCCLTTTCASSAMTKWSGWCRRPWPSCTPPQVIPPARSRSFPAPQQPRTSSLTG